MEPIKHDRGKNRMALLDAAFIIELGQVLTFGAQKYGADNWQGVESHRYKDALLRHIFAWLGGEERDEESGLGHLAHAACNLMFLHWQERQGESHPVTRLAAAAARYVCQQEWGAEPKPAPLPSSLT